MPFQLDAKAAKEAYKGFCKKKALLPRSFQSDQKIKEITGIYVPFWLFSCQAEGTINYNGQRIKKWKDQQYEYIQTDYYLVSREGRVSFDYVPVDDLWKWMTPIMESIEPYDMSKAVSFDEAYLSGYEAIKYDVSKDESRGRAQERIKTSFQDILKQSVDKKEYDINVLEKAVDMIIVVKTVAGMVKIDIYCDGNMEVRETINCLESRSIHLLYQKVLKLFMEVTDEQ
mgnify:CR=1 FL=1